MNPQNVINSMIESKLLNLHTAFIGKITSMNGDSMCSVQPLNRIKAYGKEAQQQAIIPNVPILNHVRHYKLKKQKLVIVDSRGLPCTIQADNPHPLPDDVGHLEVKPLQAGDIVFCVCGERDIAESVNGGVSTPPQGRHSLKDAVVVGLLGGW